MFLRFYWLSNSFSNFFYICGVPCNSKLQSACLLNSMSSVHTVSLLDHKYHHGIFHCLLLSAQRATDLSIAFITQALSVIVSDHCM